MTTGRRAASLEELQQIKDVTPEIAQKVRNIWRNHSHRPTARTNIDSLIGTHGVEYLGIHKRSKEDVYYCNAGDTYATTVIFVGPNMRVGCWGDLVEKNLIQERTFP